MPVLTAAVLTGIVLDLEGVARGPACLPTFAASGNGWVGSKSCLLGVGAVGGVSCLLTGPSGKYGWFATVCGSVGLGHGPEPGPVAEPVAVAAVIGLVSSGGGWGGPPLGIVPLIPEAYPVGTSAWSLAERLILP